MMAGGIDDLIHAAFQRVLDKDVSGAVQLCARLARLKNDAHSLAFFVALQENGETESIRTFISEYTGRLADEVIKKIHESGSERALQLRVMSKEQAKAFNSNDPKRNVLYIGSNLIDEEIETAKSGMQTLRPPSGMTPIDTAYFYDQTIVGLSSFNTRIQALQLIKARMLSACSGYISQIERQVQSERGSSSILHQTQESVYAFLRENSKDALAQFSIAMENVKDGDREHLSTAMTHLRRCLRSVADFVYPSTNGIESLSEEKYLNRLSKFIEDCRTKCAFQSPINVKSLEDLLRNLNDRASKGVHSHVNYFEAQQIMIAAILYIGNVSAAWELWRNREQE